MAKDKSNDRLAQLAEDYSYDKPVADAGTPAPAKVEAKVAEPVAPSGKLEEPAKTKTKEKKPKALLANIVLDDVPVSTGDDGAEELACASCRKPYPTDQLTVVSTERFNFESAIVVCPNCLEDIKSDVEKDLHKSDLILASIWGLVAMIAVTVPVALVIWSNRRAANVNVWFNWWPAIGLVVVGLIIGTAVSFGSGRKNSRAQRLIAVGYTLISLIILRYVAINCFFYYLDEIRHPDNAKLILRPLENVFWQDGLNLMGTMLTGAGQFGPSQTEYLLFFAIILGIVAGIAAAWFSSGGRRLHTRPFIRE